MKNPGASLFTVAILAVVLLLSCTRTRASLELTGTLTRQGVTTYQYGTHVLLVNSAPYALESSTVDLDQYINQTVTIIGDPEPGFPMDGGPALIEVRAVH
jgi:hypothetical protein